MTKQISEYDQQATDFLKKTGATIEITFSLFGKHFDGDKEERDIYDVTISKNKREYTFKFGNSIAHSGKFVVKIGREIHRFNDRSAAMELAGSTRDVLHNPDLAKPSAYDILAAVTKSDPGEFDDFCGEYGYDTDSRRAEQIYNAVREEYLHMAKLFSFDELEQMQEIQ